MSEGRSVIPSSPDYSRLPDDWALAVSSLGFDLVQLYADLDRIYGHPGATPVSPPKLTDVFRAFHLTALDDVRAIVLGEDPYPDPLQAHGLAFSTPPTYVGLRPTSLGRVFGGLRRNLGIRPTQDDLTPWADRGILLINVALTHRKGDVKPDLATWEQFTIHVLRVLDKQPRKVAWLLWGDFANSVADQVPTANSLHRRFENAHPRAGRAKRQTLAKAPPFRDVSSFLGSNAVSDWGL